MLGILWIISPSAGHFGLFLLSVALYLVAALFLGAALGILGVKLFFGNQVKEELLKKAGKWGGKWDEWDERSDQTKEQEDTPRFIYLVGPASSVAFFYAIGVGTILDWLVTESLFDALGIQHYLCAPYDPRGSLSHWVSVVVAMATTIVLCGFSRDSWFKS